MSRAIIAAVGIALGVAAVAQMAAADIPPVPDWDDMGCVAKAQQLPGETCKECSTTWASGDRCSQELGGEGMTRRCRSAGTKAWVEVWCRKGEAPAASASASATPSASAPSALPVASTSQGAKTAAGCAFAPGAVRSGVLMLAAWVAAWCLQRRRIAS